MDGRTIRLWTAISATAVLLVPVGCGIDGAVADSATATAASESEPEVPETEPTDDPDAPPTDTGSPDPDPTSAEPTTTEPTTTEQPSTSRATPTVTAVTTTSRATPSPGFPSLPLGLFGLPVIANPVAEASPGASLTVTDVFVERNGGFDRVVYVFAGSGTPGWRVRYVDTAVQDGSGDVFDVPGSSILEVALTGTRLPFETGVTPYAGPNPLAGSGAVTQVRMATVFEGVTQSFVGLESAAVPVTVSSATDPARVFVDVQR
ncbi:AMIN-like domain-containing (lipo)protein [Rhodococcus triatomae]|nr:hypothetical protein G419_09096 [Rhodococcus triatomae BKS 15-14]